MMGGYFIQKNYILSFDQGTTSSRAVIFDKAGKILAQNSRRHEQIYNRHGWVSHNAKEIFFNISEAGKQAITQAGINSSDIAAIGITNQRETVIAWDKKNGEPICDAIVWQCKRTSDLCLKLKNDGLEPVIREKTGLIIDSYFSASKIKWILDNIPEASRLLALGRLAFGTVDSYLIFRLTNGEKYVTDYTNASRTSLFNIHNLRWDEELLQCFGIPLDVLHNEALPTVIPSSGLEYAGRTNKIYFGEEIPIAGIAGDQHAALFGQACFEKGSVKNTYGTGCFILANIGENPAASTPSGLLTTIAWHIGGKTVYAAEGSIFSAGSAIEWLINDLKLVSDVGELEYILNSHRRGSESKSNSDSDVYFVPAFSGLGAPKWDMTARAALFGMTLGCGREQIVRAICDSIAFSVKDAIIYISELTGINIERLNVDGGVSKNNTILQFQADILNIPVSRPDNIETTALGAAGLAGLAAGVYKNFDEIKGLKGTETLFYPQIDSGLRERRCKMWDKAVDRASKWL